MNKKLFLLDAMALIYRAYFAFGRNPRINSKGLNTSAMLGFTNTLLEVIKSQKPTHIAVVFDTKVATHRHIEFPEYKAHRDAMPEELSASLPYIDKILDAFNIPKLFVDGYEADDVIGTLAKKAEKQGFTTFMMTPDKDFAQLVSENIFMYKPGRMGNPAEILGVKEVQEKFNVERPEQVIDILGLWGDAADNIPGIPGIGEKRAKEFIGKYGSVEALIEHKDELKGKMKENVINFAQQGLDSKRLATIVLDAPIELNEEDIAYQEPNYDKLKELFEELEFRTLAKRILTDLSVKQAEPKLTEKQENATLDMFALLEEEAPGTSGITVLQVLADENTNYTIVEKEHEIKRLIDNLKNQNTFSIHLITTNSNPHEAELAGIAFAWRESEAFFMPLPEYYEDGVVLLEQFKDVFLNTKTQIIGFDLKYIVSVLKWYKLDVKTKFFDIMLAHYLIEPDMKHDLSLLAENELNYKIIVSDELLGRKSEAAKRLKTTKFTFREVKPELSSQYACQRTDVILRLKDLFYQKLKETETLKLYEDVEIPLLEVLAAVETQGVNFDIKAMTDYSIVLDNRIKEIEQNIYSLARHSFNIASPKQLGVVLFEELKITDKPKLTKTKQYKTGEEILVKLKKKHKIVDFIL